MDSIAPPPIDPAPTPKRRASRSTYTYREVLRVQLLAECSALVARRIFAAFNPEKEIDAIRSENLRKRVRVAYRRVIAGREKRAA